MIYGKRAVAVDFLNRMVREGTIASFQTLHFGKAETGEDPTVIVTAAGEPDAAAMQALRRRISDALNNLVRAIVVIVQRDQPRR